MKRLLKKIKGALGFCQCDGCLQRATMEMKTIGADKKIFKVIVCEDCYWNYIRYYTVYRKH